MGNQPTRRPRSIYDRIIETIDQGEKSFIQSLKPIGTDSSVSFSGLGGGASGGGASLPATGQYVRLSGDSMNGPIAFQPVIVSTHKDGSLRGHLDISKTTGKFSPRVILNAAPSGWNLSYIDGDYWDGQLLRINIINGYTLILQPDGNISLPKSQPISFLGPIVVVLEFDSTLGPNGNSGGWILSNVPSQLNGCDVATKCYVDHMFEVAGFTQNSVIETITESAWVCLACFFNAAVIADPTPPGGLSETGVANTIFVSPPINGADYISESVVVTVI